jgi:hypothetical protein
MLVFYQSLGKYRFLILRGPHVLPRLDQVACPGAAQP